MTTAQLVVDGLSKSFTLHQQGGIRLDVLAGVSLSVNAGESVALIGASGAGKSTLLRCMYGNYSVSAGSILIRKSPDSWVDICAIPDQEVRALRRSTIGWVSQFLRVIPRVSALEVVAEPLLVRKVNREDALERAAAILSRMNLPERLWSVAPSTFSGGEQQRVNLARGLVVGHPVLLVDEPTASLDPDNAAIVVGLLNEARQNGASIVGIFHDAAVRNQVATRSFDLSLRVGIVSTAGRIFPALE